LVYRLLVFFGAFSFLASSFNNFTGNLHPHGGWKKETEAELQGSPIFPLGNRFPKKRFNVKKRLK
jgi:hypothetical protein